MGVFSSTDKKKNESDWLNLDDLSLVDVSKELNTSLNMEPRLFNRFTHYEVEQLLVSAGLISAVEKRGFPNPIIELEILNNFDNRIYIKTETKKILVHTRLKVSQFQMKGDDEQFPMIYIDWLLTQNINFEPGDIKKELYFGQEYPGLNVLNEFSISFESFPKDLEHQELLMCLNTFTMQFYFHESFVLSIQTKKEHSEPL